MCDMSMETLEKIIGTAGKILHTHADQMIASEVNPEYAVAVGLAETHRGIAQISISVFRGKSRGIPCLAGNVKVEEYRTDFNDSVWDHRTQITTGNPGPFTPSENIVILNTAFGGNYYIESNFCETNIADEEALGLLLESLPVAFQQPQHGTYGSWQTYASLKDMAEQNGSVLGDLGIFF